MGSVEIMLRVIAGSARRLRLKSIPGDATRPTTDRIKETLFNVIQNDIYGCSFLDIFSGSGQIGIEALSRGAKSAILVERSPRAAAVIRENLKHTHLEENARIMVSDALSAIPRLGRGGLTFDIIHMDPPYGMDIYMPVFKAIKKANMADADTVIIAEAALCEDFSFLEREGFVLEREKAYRTNKHIFCRVRGEYDEI